MGKMVSSVLRPPPAPKATRRLHSSEDASNSSVSPFERMFAHATPLWTFITPTATKRASPRALSRNRSRNGDVLHPYTFTHEGKPLRMKEVHPLTRLRQRSRQCIASSRSSTYAALPSTVACSAVTLPTAVGARGAVVELLIPGGTLPVQRVVVLDLERHQVTLRCALRASRS